VIIAMIRGYCLGAGVNIALCCDLRIAAEMRGSASPRRRLAWATAPLALKNLVDTVGQAYAREVLITGRQFSAAEAKTMGLVHAWRRSRIWNRSSSVLRDDFGERSSHDPKRQAHGRELLKIERDVRRGGVRGAR